MITNAIVVVGPGLSPLLGELLDDLISNALFDPDLHELFGGEDGDYDGWYCIQVTPCKCSGCGKTVCFAEPDIFHCILIWENKDDEPLLIAAEEFKQMKLEPIITQYHDYLGPCMTWEHADAQGLVDGYKRSVS